MAVDLFLYILKDLTAEEMAAYAKGGRFSPEPWEHREELPNVEIGEIDDESIQDLSWDLARPEILDDALIARIMQIGPGSRTHALTRDELRAWLDEQKGLPIIARPV